MLVDNRLVPTGTCFIAFTTANAISGDSRRPSVSFSTTSLMSSQPERRVRMAGRLNAPKQGPYHGAMSPPTGVAGRVDAGLRFFPITVGSYELVTVFEKRKLL